MKTHKHKHSVHLTVNKDILQIILSALLLAAVWIITSKYSMPSKWLIPAMFLVPYLISGFDVILEAVEKLFRGELLDEDFLMTVASVGAMCIGEYPEAVAVMLFFRIGEAFEHYAVVKSRRSVSELMDIRPDHAFIERHGELLKVSPKDVRIGTVITVSPGERIPLDGVIADGESSIDTSPLTGESMPKYLSAGQTVYSGCVNLSGVLRIKVTSTFKNSTAQRVIELVESSASSRSERETTIRKFARVYTPIVVAAALILAIFPPLIVGNWGEWIHRALIFLVISCPCALVISVPLSFFGGIGCASRNGILIKGANYIELLSQVRTVVMDKTGTVTEGSFSVAKVEPIGISAGDLLMLAAAAESFSNHPIAVSLRNACPSLPDSSLITNVREISGRGVEAKICGRRVLVGNSSLMSSNGIKVNDTEAGSTVVHVAADGVYGGYIVIDDRIKDGARQAIAELYELGVDNTVMLTGDADSTAQAVGGALRVNSIYSQLLPEDKVIAVRELMEKKHNGTLIFVGDGLNDAPVLACADVGVAMGMLGADAAIEAAGLVLMDDDLEKLPLAIRISKRTVAISKENIRISLLCKFVVLTLGALGIAGMWLAVFADVGVLILVILNALRTFKV